MPDYLKFDKQALQQEKDLLEKKLDDFRGMGLKLDMSRGKPAPDQLDLSMGLLARTDYKDDAGVDARNYGNLDGLPEAKRFFAQMLGARPEDTFVGGNASLQLMYYAIDLGWRVGYGPESEAWHNEEKPKFLCPVPGYDRHFRVTEVFGFELVMVPMTPEGPDMGVVEELVKDASVKGIWCVPVYSNPDGYTYSAETVRRLAAMECGAADFKIMWDNAYGFHHLTDVHESCPNLLEECRKAGSEDRALMFVSTSKITFAGGGVGAMAASEANMKRFNKYMFPVTICFDKLNQLRHVRFLTDEGGVDAHMKKHAALLAPKFGMVVDTLGAQLGGCGDIARWTDPKGGYFLSLYTMEGCAKRVVGLCKELGVVLTGAGAAYPYGIDPADSHIRIAPTYPTLDELKTACELLCVAVRYASVEKLLAQ